MAGVQKKKKKKDKTAWVVYGAIGLVIVGAVGFVVKLMLGDAGPRKKTQVATVTLLKPPPEKEKEKLPEPEIKKEVPKPQEVVQQVQQMPQPVAGPQNNQPPQDGPPAGSDLGVDGEGGAGSDGFGLVGKKGGRSLTIGGGGGGGGLSRMALLTKYGWYTKKVEKELWQQVKSILDKDGGIPKGKHQATIHLVLNGNGAIVSFRLVGASGNEKVDKAVKTALSSLKVSEPVPAGMPSGMTIKISSQS